MKSSLPSCKPTQAVRQPINSGMRLQTRQACRPGSQHAVWAAKGFGEAPTSTSTSASTPAPAPPSASASGDRTDEIEALEARIKSRRTRKIEPQVKVESAAVDAVTGKGPASPIAEAETNYLTAMLALFGLVLAEGLLIAASGFLPEDWDLFVHDVLYPNYTYVVLLFLLGSSVYGAWKVGKLPLPFMGPAPKLPDGE
mmetsp:Transcript_18802/g.32081  ORF Transcript_18802/g.32081 Transcript_18802/m.32081 type:complete len:198 (+) Transcript_18802:60-653(+)|eukprot:CAMPEP_0119108348 /NCGR_PEP_ID=MMETSP1180-20130426/13863_1 /TAXON_ID=3052 ORGANISM="Chlamydomonas cf sp, Strain CCMP681" /NCGR_SAMPLE_ID=MMETSP1180 /ASSEMBLY_ACC=CAM_ASM_000741 /LENGTH=197 /DNA_ID=CAMNT_0007093951 /DNA_START=39 /DNA_END=632 /DNA_ORIENTATION=-